MRRSVIAVVALVAFALPNAALAAESAPDSDPMKGWRPPKVKKEKQDRAEIAKLFKAMEAAGKKGDIEAAASFIDFPVLMMLTDDSMGEAHGAAWTREQWMKEMEPFYKPMPDMKVKENPTVFLLTDSLATVTNVATITMGKNKPFTTRNSMLLARVGGEWKVKAMVEGGWADAMGHEGSSAASQTTTPSSPGQTAPSTSETTPSSPGQTAPSTSETSPSSTGQTAPSTPSGAAGETAPPATGRTPPPGAEPPPATTR